MNLLLTTDYSLYPIEVIKDVNKSHCIQCIKRQQLLLKHLIFMLLVDRIPLDLKKERVLVDGNVEFTNRKRVHYHFLLSDCRAYEEAVKKYNYINIGSLDEYIKFFYKNQIII